ncbi:peroxisomal acyl-coenzyme A oxidase 1-like [Saccostrea echinata]|uniref:peroxisomal acyl-coenzyme A oxidase 1-like n=1 Tax=Saccostrea echinata TaxID=191078 RepID=UPI002A8161C8|nr:peroxisomal acyl-coenzyme A oxidase 1-like [Saccostrea echinata]
MATMERVNSDLARERRNSTFDVEQLTNFIYRGSEKVKRRRYLHNLAINDPVIKKAKPWAFQTREELYETALWKNLYINKKMKEHGITEPADRFYYQEAMTPHENSPIGLHTVMFIPTIEKQATKEQKERWLPLAESLKMIGTYAQTEMGHGTFIRGLETTSTYDPKTKEFVLNSPTITSMKYWPGNLGKTTNHCLVMAQLFTQGKNCGIHMFMVQIRDLETHRPLPGIEVGDIGPKFGYGTNDNGYLRLNNVRIPRENMLMRYSKVLEDGTFVKPPNAKIAYGSMVLVRAAIVTDASRALAQACVISIRYSAVRRQTEVSPGGEEAQILDYQTQQYKLFPLLATSYAMYFAGRFMYDFYLKATAEIEAGNLESMPQLHAISAGLKAFSSWTCSAGVETCRLCCGGHGYSHASGLPKIYIDCVPGCTYEGENNVMMLQVARFLMKIYGKMQNGESLPSFMQYLTTDLNKRSCMTEEVALKCLVMAYEHRAARMIRDAAANMQNLVQCGKSPMEAWIGSTVMLTWAATAHCHAFVTKHFVETITNSKMDAKVRSALTGLCKLYAVHGIVENLGGFIQDGFFDCNQVSLLQNKLMELLAEIRPNAVAFVDAFDYPDEVLQSCLGRYDGQVYQALYEYAKSSPLNEKEVLDSYHKYIKPAQQGNGAIYQISKL